MKATYNNFSARVIWAGALILLLCVFAYIAGKEGLSNFYAQSAHMEVERWSQPGMRIKGGEGARVMEYLGNSLDYSPRNPWPLEELGTLQLRGMGAVRDPELAVAAARSANESFRKALKERPTSPFSWANLLRTKLYLDEKDEELFQGIERAEQLGPWEPEVQQTVIFAGLTVWDRLNPAQQAAVVRAMQHGAQRNPGKIAEIAQTFSRIDLFCALSYSRVQGREQGREICSKTGDSGSKPNRQQ